MLKLLPSKVEEKLKAMMKCGGTESDHNNDVLTQVEKLGDQGFAKLREIVRFMNEEVDAYEECLEQLDTIGWDPKDASKHYTDGNAKLM